MCGKDSKLQGVFGKKGELLISNIIFIVLNLVFLAILIVFIVKQGSGAIVLEQSYAKQIALLIDSAKPITEVRMDMKEGIEKAKNEIGEERIKNKEVVKITGNLVTVKITDKGGYSYNFFNDVDATAYPEIVNGEFTGFYIIKINNYR